MLISINRRSFFLLATLFFFSSTIFSFPNNAFEHVKCNLHFGQNVVQPDCGHRFAISLFSPLPSVCLRYSFDQRQRILWWRQGAQNLYVNIIVWKQGLNLLSVSVFKCLSMCVWLCDCVIVWICVCTRIFATVCLYELESFKLMCIKCKVVCVCE